MKKIKFLAAIILLPAMVHAQSLAVNTDGSAAHPNAIVDIKGTNKGLLIPRGNVATRTALNANTAKGLMMYDTVLHSLWRHNGNGLASGWNSLSLGENYWIQQGALGTEIKNTNSGGFWSANATTVTGNPGIIQPPVSGAGTRLMWIPQKSAFRVGTVESNYWNADSIGTWSFASGYDTKATGIYATAMGYYTSATEEGSTAMGIGTTASGIFATAFGSGATASGYVSFASGNATTASGQTATAFGYNTIASGESATAMGFNTVATGWYSTAIGENNRADGNYATVMGSGNDASGLASTSLGNLTRATAFVSTAMGQATSATGEFSTSMGRGTVSQSLASVAMGNYNDSIISSNQTSWIATDPLFLLGNGTANNARSNAFVIYKNGNTDISGYTQLGTPAEGAPAIKMKKLITTSAAAQGGLVTIAHGLTRSKILGVQILLTYAAGFADIPGPYLDVAGYEYNWQVTNTDINIYNKTGNSINILSKPIRILITYEE